MLIPTLILAIVAIALYVIAVRQGDGADRAGLTIAWRLGLEVLPLLVFAFIVAGLAQVLLPKELLARWVGTESGLKGIFIGAIAGGLTPGGPYVNLPIVAALLRAGAGVGTMVAFLTGWSLWAVARLPMEFGMLGWRFTLMRMAATLIFPPLAGIIAHLLFGRVAPF
ncbi:MAG: permease [Candidatus Krumholzibacteriia bacterium]|nr:permease [bacterium]